MANEIIRKAPNGQPISFDAGTSEEYISKYLALPEFQKQLPKRGALKDMSIGVVYGVRDGVQATVGLVEGLSDTLGEATNVGGFVFGKDAKNGVLGYENFAEFKANKRKGLLFGEKGVNDGLTLPDFDGDPHTWQGNLAKGVSQFATGWFTGGRVLGVAGK